MVFSSVVFLFFFLPVVLSLYFLPSFKWRDWFFLAASLFFFAWSEGGYLLVLLFSITVNFIFGLMLKRVVQQDDRSACAALHSGKIVLAFGLACNLGLLVIFKYTNFLASNLNFALLRLGFSPVEVSTAYAPLGISFFTFHAISYLVDIYRGEAEAQTDPGAVGLYLAAFPKILAGPIIPYRNALPQLAARTVTRAGFVLGIERFVCGFAKKVLLANPLAAVADTVFGMQPTAVSAPTAWIGILCYTLQIYFDFSGYSDMAIGLGKMFGFDLPENFNFPYISQSVREFWRRWHISLSLWFRDYLYIPLGGNRKDGFRTCCNLMLVFLLCGLWHGASWNFIVWGSWYGIFLILERTQWGGVIDSLPRFLRHFYLLFVVVIGWVFFRADNLSSALAFLKTLFGFHSGEAKVGPLALHLNNEIFFLFVVAAVLCLPVSDAIRRTAPQILSVRAERLSPVRTVGLQVSYGFWLSLLFFLSVMSLAGGTHKAFIYFKF